MRMASLTLALAVGLALTAPSPAGAYRWAKSAHGARLNWVAPSLRVWFERLPPELESDAARFVTRRALRAWMAPDCTRLALIEDPRAQIVVRWVPADAWPHPPTLAAHTDVRSDAGTGRIRGATVLLNGAFRFALAPDGEALDFESILTHELGHALGLAHSRKRRALMRAGIKPGVQKRELAPDDIDGVCALFPR